MCPDVRESVEDRLGTLCAACLTAWSCKVVAVEGWLPQMLPCIRALTSFQSRIAVLFPHPEQNFDCAGMVWTYAADVPLPS